MFFETRVDPPPTSPLFRASAESFRAGRVREARASAPTRLVDAGDALLCIDIMRAEGRADRARALAVLAARRFPGHALVVLELAHVRRGTRALSALSRITAGDLLVDARVGALRARLASADEITARSLIAKYGVVADAIVELDLGKACAALGDFTGAIEHYVRAKALAPRWCGAGLALCEAQLVLGRLDDADRALADVSGRGDEDIGVEMHAVALDFLRGSGTRASARLDEARGRWRALDDVDDVRAFAVGGMASALREAAATLRAHGKDAQRLDDAIAALESTESVAVTTPVHATPRQVSGLESALDAPEQTVPMPRAPDPDDLPDATADVTSNVLSDAAPAADRTAPNIIAPVIARDPASDTLRNVRDVSSDTAPVATAPAAASSDTAPSVASPAAAASSDTAPSAAASAAPAATVVNAEGVTVKKPIELDADDDDFKITKRKAALAGDTERIRIRKRPADSDEEPAHAAADWGNSRADILAPKLNAPSPWPKRAAAGVAVVLVAVCAAWFATRPAVAVPVAVPAAVATTTPAPQRHVDPSPAATFQARAKGCGVAVPSVAIGVPFDEQHATSCEPLARGLRPDDKRGPGWRACSVEGTGKLIVRADGAVYGAVVDGKDGRTIADSFPASLEFGALRESALKGGRGRAVMTEADCDGVSLFVHASCPEAMVKFKVDHGDKLANPAPLPGCTLISAYVVNGYL